MRRLQANPANTTFKALGFYVEVHVWEPPLLPAGMSTKPAQVRWQLVLMQLAIMLDNVNHIPGVTNPMVRILFDHQGKKACYKRCKATTNRKLCPCLLAQQQTLEAHATVQHRSSGQ